MLLWLASASATPLPASVHFGPAHAVIEARATVRIVSGARVKLGPQQKSDPQSSDVPPQHDTIVVADGSQRPAKLIEFE